MKKIVVKVGDQINDWTMIDCPAKGRVTGACACGKIKTAWSCDFYDYPRCRSCSQRLRAQQISPRELAHRQWYSDYKNNAKSDKREFSLTLEEFLVLVNSNCYYCDDPPSHALVKRQQVFLVHGIDRVDSSIGYNSLNVLPCCTICNIMKNTLSLTEFESKISQVHRTLSAKGVNG